MFQPHFTTILQLFDSLDNAIATMICALISLIGFTVLAASMDNSCLQQLESMISNPKDAALLAYFVEENPNFTVENASFYQSGDNLDDLYSEFHDDHGSNVKVATKARFKAALQILTCEKEKAEEAAVQAKGQAKEAKEVKEAKETEVSEPNKKQTKQTKREKIKNNQSIVANLSKMTVARGIPVLKVYSVDYVNDAGLKLWWASHPHSGYEICQFFVKCMKHMSNVCEISEHRWFSCTRSW